MHHCWLYVSRLFFHATGTPFWLLRFAWPLLVLNSTLDSFCCFLLPGFFDFCVAAVVLRIWETVLSSGIFIYPLFLYLWWMHHNNLLLSMFPRSRQFNFDEARDSSFSGSKRSPDPSVNHTTICKLYVQKKLYLNMSNMVVYFLRWKL